MNLPTPASLPWTCAPAALACGLVLGPALAAELPRWEAGVGVARVGLADYRGSPEYRRFDTLVPYLVYRGDTVKADREGTRAQLWGTDRVHLDIYLGGNLPVSSQRNLARRGMPSFKGSLDVGPALDVRLSETPDEATLVKLRLPLSYGFTLGKQQQSLGWQTAPSLNIYTRDTWGWSGLSGTVRTGPIFATRQRNAYFYDVQPAYATDARPAYASSAGYGGWQLGGSLSKRFERFWVGAYVRYDSLGRAVFRDSPLVRTDHYLMGGMAVVWVLGESSQRVNVE